MFKRNDAVTYQGQPATVIAADSDERADVWIILDADPDTSLFVSPGTLTAR